MKKTLIVFGTRPEAIKMAPLVKKLQERKTVFQTAVCVTAQHREMLDQVLEIFDIEPDYDLDIMKPGQDLYDVTANVLTGMKRVLEEYRPDMVLVHGDTTTTFATALAAFYDKRAVGHVEAGLRTNDIYSPWPEEANRQLASRLSRLHFAPTAKSRENLLKENIPQTHVTVTGNTVIDALYMVLERIKNDPVLERKMIQKIQSSIREPILETEKGRLILVTGHRRENFGQGFIDICEALKSVALKNPDVHIVYPVHLNPNVQKPVNEILGDLPNIHLIPPLEYEPFVYLMSRSYIIVTDSGGIQEEAPSLGKPVLVMRETTERPEAVEAGTVKLVGTDRELIQKSIQELLQNPALYNSMARAHNPYGDGKACERIAETLENFFKA
ncbi:UDP-N-acetylglucosamine 2-epimerase (non-hydrolyzing) [Hydrogenimonas sp. SS33]|uniref:non-hydrolyzing UDP-N-acetylglucosamine 2-epimerase n=1 Tax=Hydrogenimonas leucolamina TaxID=2954236 RepID=UPI00336BEB39